MRVMAFDDEEVGGQLMDRSESHPVIVLHGPHATLTPSCEQGFRRAWHLVTKH